MYGLVANVIIDKGLRTNARVAILACRNKAEGVEVYGFNRYGRTITKFTSWKRLTNVRVSFIPEHVRRYYSLSWADKDEAKKAAELVTKIFSEVQFFHRDGTLLRPGITLREAMEKHLDDKDVRLRGIFPPAFLEAACN